MALDYAPKNTDPDNLPDWLPEKFRKRWLARKNPPPNVVPPPGPINKTSQKAEERQLQVAGEGAPLRVVLGMDCIGAQVGPMWYHLGKLYVRCIWAGGGENEGVQSVTLNGEPLPAGVLVTHYTGTAAQGIDPWLAAAGLAQTPAITYTDTLPGIAYSVFALPSSALTAPPEFAAVFKGLKLYDPRQNLWTYSNDFSNAAWTKTGVAVAQNAAAPDGSLTAWTVTDDSAGAYEWLSRAYAIAADTESYTISCRVKKTSGGTSATAQLSITTSGGTAQSAHTRFNTDTGEEYAYTAWTVETDPRNQDWWLCRATYTNNGTNTAINFACYPAVAPHGSGAGDVATTGSAVVCWAQLERSAAPCGYVDTTSAAYDRPTAWNDNAGLALRSFITGAWGENKPITGGDGDVVARCDWLCGTVPNTEKRSRIGITLDSRQPASAWRETLRTYAECFVVPDGDGYLLIPDAPAASEYTYSHDAGNLLELGSLKKSGSSDLPTVMTVWYTDRSKEPWKDIAIDPIKRDGVDAGTVEWRPQEIRLNGVFSRGQAHRIGTMRLNKLWLCDLSGDIHTLDDGMQVRPGTVVTLVDPRIGAGKQVRVFGSSGVNGQYVQTFTEHDNAAYSDAVIEDPSTPDTTYPLPNDPPAITGLTVAEAFVPMQTGRGGTRFYVSWDAPDYIFLTGYRVECWAGTQLIDSAPVSGAAYASPFLQEGVYYTIKVATLSSVAQSDWVQDAVLAQGKLLKPGDVPFFNAFELGNVVYFFITPGSDLDRTGHEYRRATINGAETIEQHWARGTLVERVADPAVTFASPNQPVGTWRYMVKCLDSVRSALYPSGQESVNAAYKDVTVTSDAKSFWSDEYQFTTHTLTNMVEYLDYPPVRDKYISTSGASVNAALPNAANTYPNPIATYAAPVSSEFLTGSHDFGALVAGQWFVDIATADCSIADLTGTHQVSLELSANGTAWTSYSGTSVVASGRYARVRIGSAGVMVITGHPTVRVQAAPKTEVKTVTTSASGPVTLTLDGHYIAAVSITTQSVGTTQASHSWDDVSLSPTAPNTVQIRAWNQAGAFVAMQVQVTFNGILA